jgi:hypothetical protein
VTTIYTQRTGRDGAKPLEGAVSTPFESTKGGRVEYAKLTVRELLELDELDQIETSYSVKPPVVGLESVRTGFRPLYPVTVYQLEGDDTSGIVGILYPSGNFIPVVKPRHVAKFWEFDETLKYEAVPNLHVSDINPGLTRVVGNSWTAGEVLWDGVAAEIDTLVPMETEVHVSARQQDAGTMFNKTVTVKVTPHVRQADRNSVTGEWATTGELYRSIEQGVSMRQRGPVIGKVHVTHLGGERTL